jgi:hypothetical protein
MNSIIFVHIEYDISHKKFWLCENNFQKNENPDIDCCFNRNCAKLRYKFSKSNTFLQWM